MNKGKGREDILIAGREPINVTPKFRGTVISIHQGFSYIGGIKRGTETINTNGDVFVPAELNPGTLVEFDVLNVDTKRSGDLGKKFRTESVSVIDTTVPANILSSPADLVLFSSERRSIYHHNAKEIDLEKARKAAENEPFIEMMGLARETAERKVTPENDVVAIAESFLRSTFASFSTMNVAYSIKGDVDIEKENEMIKKIAEEYDQAGLYSQKDSILDEYQYFSGVREVFTMMEREQILHMDAVIPIRHLPDLLVTAPVWYIDTKDDRGGAYEIVNYFSNEVDTNQFSILFQLYNLNQRPIRNFDSRRDIMPVPIMKILKKARRIFDFTVIATPYHDLASEEWKTVWIRNIDPFLFGFVKGLPFMFLLGRWSGTGLFPLMCEMVADTIDHLRQNCQLLKGIAPSRNNEIEMVNYKNAEWVNVSGTHLYELAQKVIGAFDEGNLFSFMRGENTNAGAVVTR
jgi:hypothetical protein